MKKVFSIILRIICGFWGIYFLLASIGGILICFTDTSVPIVLCLLLTVIFAIVGILLIKIAFNKQKSNTDSTVNRNINNIPNTTPYQANQSVATCSTRTQNEPRYQPTSFQASNGRLKTSVVVPTVSNEFKTNMHQAYSTMQLQDDIRILNDCIHILNSTRNLDTFFSRYELAMQTILTLEQAKQSGIIINIPVTSQDIILLKGRADKVLQAAYDKELKEIDALKTVNGKKNRIDKFILHLSEYHDEFEFSDTYNNIISELNIYKKEL